MTTIIVYKQRTAGKTILLFHLFFALILLNFFPKTCLADANRIFGDNKSRVVILFSYDKEGRQIDHATGFIVRDDGAVLTSYHFVSNAAEIKIKTEDTMLHVKGILYIDRKNDIAVLKIEGKDLTAVKISDDVIGPEGQRIYMIGSPRGEDKILFEGTLRGVKDITPERKLLLITAPVTKGSSGSPVFNEKGEVIGIATFFMDEAQPFYFAMPVSRVKSGLSVKKITPLDKAELIASENTTEHWFNLGAVYDSLGMYTDASGAYQRAIEIDPEDAIAHNNLGVVYANLGIYSYAIREHNEAISLKPDYQEAYYNLGVDYIKSDKVQMAAETFETAIRLKPDDARSYNNLAIAFFKSGKLKEALETIKQTILIKSDYPEAYYNLGAVYSQMNMYAEAAEALKQFIRLKPDVPEVHLRLGIIYSMQDTDSALKEYEILKNLDTESAQVLQKIIQLKKDSSSETAVSSVDAAKEKSQQQPAAVTPPKQALSYALSTSPLKKGLPPQTTAGSENGSASSDEIDRAEDNSRPEATRKIERTSKKDIYSIQLSTFNDKNNALSLSKRLKKKGYDVFIKTEYKDDKTASYRVLVGRFSDKAKALKASSAILKKEKLKSIIFKH